MADGSGPLAYLGVSRSLTGRAWRQRPADPALARAHEMRLGLMAPLARALAARGVSEAEAEAFLRPTLRAMFPDPSCFHDMDLAATLIVDALAAKRRCVVFADYDVDGATSAALLVRWFRAMGAELALYVPDRMTEGYGPTAAAFRRLKADGAELVITVDCGAAAHDALEAAADMGLPVVVVDHHMMRLGEAPRAAALVNPNHPACTSGQGHLAAAGVVLVLLAALSREARRRGLEGAPDVLRWLDLAALGAICDVTRLTGFNRAIAAQGLRVMSGWGNAGLAALAQLAGIRAVGEGGAEASTFHAGFLLGPRINAGGRIGRSDLGARLLATDDPQEAMALAEELDTLNSERKAVEAHAFEEAARRIEAEHDPAAAALVIAGEAWHPGVVGIVAGRLRERFRKPAVVIGVDAAAGIGKGSGRSQPGVNLGRAVQAAHAEGLLLAGGGHAMAAGLTVRVGRIDALRDFLIERLGAEQAIAAAQDALDVDALVGPAGADRALWSAFQALQPYGPGNPEPTFALASARVASARALRGGHVRVELAASDGEGRLKAVAWRAEETELGRRLLSRDGLLHVAGRLRPDDWMGREGVELEVEDVADPRRAA